MNLKGSIKYVQFEVISRKLFEKGMHFLISLLAPVVESE